MTLIEAFQKELEEEALITRKMLQRVPTEEQGWKPHEKSMELGRLVSHIVELPSWIPMTLDTDELDFAQHPYTPPVFRNETELMALFERMLNEGRDALRRARPEQLGERWVLREGETVYSESTKGEVIRMSLSQIIHHRAQLGVYLRLMGVPIPGSYGPSADELSFA